jgi:hypothetical protein
MNEDNMNNTNETWETTTFEGRKIVMRSLVGSCSANLNTPESDEDYKYFVAPTFDDLYTGKMFATSSVTPTLDYDVHDIRQLANLLWKANLNFIGALMTIDFIVDDLLFIRDNADALASMNMPYLYNSTMGMHFEKMSKLEKGTGNTQILVDTFGYDTKQACHAMRCLFVLHRIASGMTVREALWFEDGNRRDMLLGIKAGNMTLVEFEEYVALWRAIHDEPVKVWFAEQKANEYLKTQLDNSIKEFIRVNI